MSSVDTIDRTVEATNHWLGDLASELGTDDRRHAYQVLRAVFHALRDRMGTNESAQLAAQLPLLLRGTYYENWRPGATPQRYHDVDTFLRRIGDEAHLAGETEASFAAAAAWRVLGLHVSEGELDDVLAVLPAPVRDLLVAPVGPPASR
jgi:uncharacterized protein (DUF2267 family)